VPARRNGLDGNLVAGCVSNAVCSASHAASLPLPKALRLAVTRSRREPSCLRRWCKLIESAASGVILRSRPLIRRSSSCDDPRNPARRKTTASSASNCVPDNDNLTRRVTRQPVLAITRGAHSPRVDLLALRLSGGVSPNPGSPLRTTCRPHCGSGARGSHTLKEQVSAHH
jgi:hypothetical protein